MQVEVKAPEDLEDGGDILDVFVSVGEEISKGQDLIEVETDKATTPVPSSHGGKVVDIKVNVGDTIAAGGTILVLESSDAGSAPAAPATPAPAAAPPPAPAAPAPAPEPVQAAPATPPPATPPSIAAQPSPSPAAHTPQPAASKRVAPAGPAVRRFAREVGVDIGTVAGSGPGGRITREDVLAVVRQANQPSGGTAAAVASQVSSSTSRPTSDLPGDPSADKWGPVQIQKMPKIRKTIASKMHESWSTVPRVTNFDDADVTALEAMRQASKADYAESGIKLTSMPFIIKACALALRSNPLINASIDMENEQIIYKQYVNIGVAVDTDRGLVVPSLRNADQLSIPSVARALGGIAESAREGKFTVDDLRGSTFTISNLGAIGGTYSTPIINTPEVAILLVGRSRKLPVVVDDKIEVRLMMPLSLSYDHRLVDGGTAARFLNDVIGYLSTPSRLLMAP